MATVETLQPIPADGITPRAPRRWTRVAALAALTAVTLYGCYLLVAPFLPGVVGGVALVAVGLPLHKWVRRQIPSDAWAAGVTTLVAVLVIFVPLGWVAGRLTVEAQVGAQILEERAGGGRWRQVVAEVPYLGGWVDRLERQNVSVEREVRQTVAQLGQTTLGVVQGTLAGVLQLLIALFVAYFGFRDHEHLLNGLRELLPLDRADADRVIERVDGAIYATVYGTVLTGLLQGVTGGLLFWWLGLPAPVLWGVVMTVLSVLPVLGAFLVWVPAAVYLVAEARYGAAAALVAWGLLMAGPVCNYVYAVAAGGRMKLHPVPALLAFVGGLAAFGIAGMILGPMVLAAAVALLDVWRQRVMRTQPGPLMPAGG